MTNTNEDIISIERVEPPEDVKRKMNREFLPKNIKETMLRMEDGDSFFLKTDDQDKKMFTLRSMIYRHYENHGKAFKYTLNREEKDGCPGLRVYKSKATNGEVDEYPQPS